MLSRSPATVLIVTLFFMALAPATWGQTDILAFETPYLAYGIDSTSGAGLPVSPAASSGYIAGLAVDDTTGAVYALGGVSCGVLGCGPPSVWRVNPSTGQSQGTAVPLVGIFAPLALAADSNGTLYLAGFLSFGSPQFELRTLDATTGQTTTVGPLPLSITALDFDAAGTLWGWDRIDGLVTIDPATAIVTPIAPGSGDDQIQSIAFSSTGELFGIRDLLVSIDPMTGARHLVGGGAWSNVFAMEFVGPAISPAYPGNGADASLLLELNGQTLPGDGIASVGGGGLFRLSFHSPQGSLVGMPLAAVASARPSGSPFAVTGFPGEPGTIWIDPQAALILFDGLQSPIGLAPVIGAGGFHFGPFVAPPALLGTQTSIFVQGFVSAPGFNPFNLGVTRALEIRF